ncbi:MAG TPA: GIY-YIG nuclease family protein [Caulobacterales bacterium]|nr:GIY-YIG nuclease family protein [Caulobacterales bacterium]
MANQNKRDLIRAYKERKPRRGVFAVRCAPTGEVWVSSSPNLDSQQNSTWFGLNSGGHPNKELQAAWKAHGQAAFSYEILEELAEDDVSAYAVKADLKSLAESWREQLGARAVTG